MIHHKDPMEEKLNAWSDALERLEELEKAAAKEKLMFEVWESGERAALMEKKISAVRSEMLVKRNVWYVTKYWAWKEKAIEAETAKRLLDHCRADWSSEQSRNANTRGLK